MSLLRTLQRIGAQHAPELAAEARALADRGVRALPVQARAYAGAAADALAASGAALLVDGKLAVDGHAVLAKGLSLLGQRRLGTLQRALDEARPLVKRRAKR